MLAAQKAYGPHQTNSSRDCEIALGCSLHRLLPEDVYDRQPVHGADGDLLVADVRLDNRAELEKALAIERLAAPLADADLLSRALDRWGEDALSRIEGDFAFALWKRRDRRLILARDFLGQRPLVYHRGSGFFAFASMPSGLHALPEVPSAPDLETISEFLALLPEDKERSHFADILKVQPGHVVTIAQGTISSRKYWNPSLETIRLKNDREYEEALREKFDAAVSARLRGCGGVVASHLSAGLDSASVTSTAARLLSQENGRVVAITSVPREGVRGAAPKGRIADEGPLAKATAGLHPNIDHVLVRSITQSPLYALDRHYNLYQRPVLNLINFVWLDDIKDEIRRRGLTVLLTGARGNASLSYHGLGLLSTMLSSGNLRGLIGEVLALRKSGLGWGGIGSHALGPFVPEWVGRFVAAVSGRETTTAYSMLSVESWRRWRLLEKARSSGLGILQHPDSNSVSARLLALGRVDYGNYNKGTLAGWGIDTRDPTADRKLVEFCLRVPEEQYLVNGVTRSLIKRVMADRIPSSVLFEKRKGYQAADWNESLASSRLDARGEVERLLRHTAASEVLDMGRMQNLVRDWPAGNWQRSDIIRNYRLGLLRGLAAGHFLRRSSGSNQ